MDGTADSGEVGKSGQLHSLVSAILARAGTSKAASLDLVGLAASTSHPNQNGTETQDEPNFKDSQETILPACDVPTQPQNVHGPAPPDINVPALPPNGVRVVYGGRTIKGYAHPNEDRIAITTLDCWPHPGETSKTPSITMVGGLSASDTTTGDGWTADASEPQGRRAFCWICCDGHDGPQAAEHFITHFPGIFQRLLLSDENKLLPPQREHKISSTLVLAHVEAERVLRSSFDDARCNPALGTSLDASRSRCTSGTCVTTAFMIDSQVWFANLGDCTAWLLRYQSDGPRSRSASSGVLVDNILFSKVTKDHRASEASEKKRITQLHGRIICGRVGGLLEPSRTIGDFDVKDTQPANVVTCVPDVRCFNATGPALILMGTDGVWDALKEHDIVMLLQRQNIWSDVVSWLRSEGPLNRESATRICPNASQLSNISDLIVKRARQKGSEDDASCTTILLLPTTDA
eukprot:Selendium_serpulae@DN5968_c0_g1_i13.p2